MSRFAIIFPPTCTCFEQIGGKQYDYEVKILLLKELGATNANALALNELGYNKMCCRSSIMNCPMFFIKSTDTYRSRDLISNVAIDSAMINIPDTVPNFPKL